MYDRALDLCNDLQAIYFNEYNELLDAKINKMKHQYDPFKVGLSLPKKKCVICFIESPLKMMKNAFFHLSFSSFILKMFKFLSWLFGHVQKTAWLER